MFPMASIFCSSLRSTKVLAVILIAFMVSAPHCLPWRNFVEARHFATQPTTMVCAPHCFPSRIFLLHIVLALVRPRIVINDTKFPISYEFPKCLSGSFALLSSSDASAFTFIAGSGLPALNLNPISQGCFNLFLCERIHNKTVYKGSRNMAS